MAFFWQFLLRTDGWAEIGGTLGGPRGPRTIAIASAVLYHSLLKDMTMNVEIVSTAFQSLPKLILPLLELVFFL